MKKLFLFCMLTACLSLTLYAQKNIPYPEGLSYECLRKEVAHLPLNDPIKRNSLSQRLWKAVCICYDYRKNKEYLPQASYEFDGFLGMISLLNYKQISQTSEFKLLHPLYKQGQTEGLIDSPAYTQFHKEFAGMLDACNKLPLQEQKAREITLELIRYCAIHELCIDDSH